VYCVYLDEMPLELEKVFKVRLVWSLELLKLQHDVKLEERKQSATENETDCKLADGSPNYPQQAEDVSKV
jgi:hypothetical protein